MAKDIVIQESGVDTSLSNIDKLRTKQLGGGTVNWVPEDETQSADLTVNENGTFTAADDGYYCYGNVTVDVAGGGGSWVSGTAPDGNDYIFEFDDSTGEVTQELLPSSIEVTTPPTKLEYYEGEQIDFNGIVVTAYDGNGNAWDVDGYQGGIIPFGELRFPTTTAHADGSGEGVYENANTDIDIGAPKHLNGPISYCKAVPPVIDGADELYEKGWVVGQLSNGNPLAVAFVDETYARDIWITSFLRPDGGLTAIAASDGYFRHFIMSGVAGTPGSMSLNGKTVHMLSWTYPSGSSAIVQSAYTDISESYLAWACVYGDGFTLRGNQSVPVNWPRYGDSEILTDSFGIQVYEHEGWGDDTGDEGSTSGGGDF